MNVDLRLTSPPAAVLGAERGQWLYRGLYLAFVIGGLALEALAVLLGSMIALDIAPHLATYDEIYGLTLAYVVISAIATIVREAVKRREEEAAWLLWLALLLGLVATRSHAQLDIEALIVWFGFSIFCILGTRSVVRRLIATALAGCLPRRPIAFIGNSHSAAMMLAQIGADRRSRFQTVGFFDDRLDRPGPLTELLPCLGTVSDLVNYIHNAELDEVYMALPWSAGIRISELLERLRFLPLTVKLIPDHVPPALVGRGDGQFLGVVMPTLMIPPFSAAGAVFKRSVDILGVCALLFPLIPLFLLVALFIKVDSKGPVLFRQMRSGQYGRQFSILKFRSLHVAQADAAAETLVTSGDRRVTRVGRYLRKYSIDELPQVFNVLFGQMSLVGPRPHAPRAKADGRIYAEVIPEYMLRYRVKPGMTGWAQVNGWRGNTDTEEQLRKRVEFDFQYIGKWSPLRDLEIMVRTIPSMLMPPSGNV
ncbi:exopolysaccharide biosynthesis polyprenyl glycosylphosphotransferase [Lichenicola sp.]|uniref:exopolysaccharide biosynthesis polyprenyl glycosylphosphotransferase n=1 Tax=Lichenicola sp. TaxID=2804529 RepID=UPI003B00882A